MRFNKIIIACLLLINFSLGYVGYQYYLALKPTTIVVAGFQPEEEVTIRSFGLFYHSVTANEFGKATFEEIYPNHSVIVKSETFARLGMKLPTNDMGYVLKLIDEREKEKKESLIENMLVNNFLKHMRSLDPSITQKHDGLWDACPPKKQPTCED